MKNLFYITLSMALFAAVNVDAQSHFKLIFKGTCQETNSSGRVITRAVTDQTWLRDFAREKGLTSIRNLAISYHVKASELGDQIEVINARTGEVQGSVFGLFFSEAFGRTGLTNASATQTMTLPYLYTSQDSHSLGAAVVTKTQPSSTQRYLKVQGQMHYELLPTANRKSLQICSGNFVTGAPFQFQTAK